VTQKELFMGRKSTRTVTETEVEVELAIRALELKRIKKIQVYELNRNQ